MTTTNTTSVTGDILEITLKEMRKSCIPLESISAIFDFENETISFECHYCNQIITSMTIDFQGNYKYNPDK